MKTFPLQSLTIIEAQQKQFALVDSICRHFPGSEFLTGGDLGLTPGLNQPRVTQRVELAPRFTPAVARSRAHRRWKYCVVWCLRQ